MPDLADALVAGGGPAGSATALRLARAGHRVVLVDKAQFPRPKCCSEYSSPAALDELDKLDLLAPVLALRSTRLTGSTITAASGATLTGEFGAAVGHRLAPHGLALPRREFDAVVLAAARDAGATVIESTRLEELTRTDDGSVTATLRSGMRRWQQRARVVVGADGLRSRVARHTGGQRHGRLRRLAFVTHIRGVAGLTTRAELHVGAPGYVGLNPIGDDLVNLALVVPAAEVRGSAASPATFLALRLRGFPEVWCRLAQPLAFDEVMVTGPFAVQGRRVAADGVALVGDAADFFDPFTGEGIWAALVGARLLADTLDPILRCGAPVTAETLSPYRTARHTAFRGKWIVERAIGHAMQWPALFGGAVRRLDRAGLGDLAVGVCGDCIPARELLTPRTIRRLVRGAVGCGPDRPSTLDHPMRTSRTHKDGRGSARPLRHHG